MHEFNGGLNIDEHPEIRHKLALSGWFGVGACCAITKCSSTKQGDLVFPQVSLTPSNNSRVEA